ncbi:MAG TPA: hypothetical protein VFN31_00100 [Candidatus Saccharimonadales bacterium]|nr:hypothetical protein [Candidatus Saccharimonadales bacterium]
MTKTDRKVIDRVFVLLGLVMLIVLIIIGGLALKASSFAKSSVKSELSAQHIYFPESSSPAINALPAENQAQMDNYAAQQLVNGYQAKVYADYFIAYHLSKVAGGETYSQISTKALTDPTNPQLKAEEQTLFQGETLRVLQLGDGYSYWTFGKIAGYVADTAFIGAVVMLVLVYLGMRRINN